MDMKLEAKLYEYLKLFWLRPENGLLCTFKSRAFEHFVMEGPSLDISCADGLFMFIHLGGVFGMDFDIFSATKAREFRHDTFVDIFDHYEQFYHPSIEKQAAQKIDCGTDWKQGLLDKAEKLELYSKLVLHDNNMVPMPLPDEHYQTVYSNSIYWVKDVEQLVRDVHRTMKPGGRAILEVATPFLLKSLDEFGKVLSPAAISILDRKRRATMPGRITLKSWEKLFSSLNFKIEEIKSVYPSKIMMDIWNIGLRPVAHLLVRMTEAISPEERRSIKQEWVEIMFELSKPLLSLEQSYTLDDAPYLCFILRK